MDEELELAEQKARVEPAEQRARAEQKSSSV